MREARKAERMTLQQVGAALGLSASQISKYENGLDRVPADRLPAMAALLGVQVGWLFEEVSPEPAAAGQDDSTATAMAALLRRITSTPQRDALCRLARSMAEAAELESGDGDAGRSWSAAVGERRPRRPLTAAALPGSGLEALLAQCLTGALDRLRLDYQPMLSTDGVQLLGFEGLLRWSGVEPVTTRALLAAAASQTEALDHWVLQTGIAQAAAWLPRAPGLRLYLNLSGGLLRDPACAEEVAGMLRRRGVPPAAICLEVTETILLDETAFERLRALRGLGLALAIDDFGTGQSSLARLMALEVDVVKLDRAFLAPAPVPDSRQQSMLGALVGLVHAVGAQAVAEGFESGEALLAARRAGCDGVQGFLLSTALPAEQAARWLDRPGPRHQTRSGGTVAGP
jgi:EAL domain-containing protein (putative c-di-GMP-specific phosphodiesterase class I)